jgi:hypothetical protein
MLCSPNITVARGEALLALHPNGFQVQAGWMGSSNLIRTLSACDATAFLYSTGNSGTSAAIRLGIAAERPVIAATGCRQFRDLVQDSLAARALSWVAPTVEEVARELHALSHKDYWGPKRRLVAELHMQDSWKLGGRIYGQHYANLGEQVRAHRAGKVEAGA